MARLSTQASLNWVGDTHTQPPQGYAGHSCCGYLSQKTTEVPEDKEPSPEQGEPSREFLSCAESKQQVSKGQKLRKSSLKGEHPGC